MITKITAYAVSYRYPEAERKPLTMTKAKSVLKIANVIFEICLDELRK